MNQFTKAVKSLAAKYNETSLILRIAIGLFIGAVLALICPGAVWLEEFGSLFVGALKGIAPVLVFVIVASALAQGSSKLDRRFGTVVWLYMLTTFVAAALSVLTSKLFPQTLVLAEAATADVAVRMSSYSFIKRSCAVSCLVASSSSPLPSVLSAIFAFSILILPLSFLSLSSRNGVLSSSSSDISSRRSNSCCAFSSCF